MVFNRKRCAAVISAAAFVLNIFSAFAAWDGYSGADETTVSLVDFNNIFDVRATKGSAEQVHTLDKKLYSIGWQNMSSPNALYLANIPSDWSEFERLDFMIYSEKATADNQMVVLVETKRGTDNVFRYCYTKVDLNWEGWKNVSISLADMIRTREPDMSKVTQVRLTTNGWDTNPNGCEASVYIARATVGKSDGTSLRTLYDAETIEKAYAAIEGGAAAYAGSCGVVTTGGEVRKISAAAETVAGTVMAPSEFFEAYMGAEIGTADGGYSIKLGEKTLEGKLDDTAYTIDGVSGSFAAAPRIIGDTAYFPAAQTARALGWYAAEDRSLAAISPTDGVCALNRVFGVNELSEIIAYTAAHSSPEEGSLTADACTAVKDKWRYELVGSEEDNDMTNPYIAEKINSVNAAAQSVWNTLIKEDGQTELFSGDNTVTTADMTAVYRKLYSMVLGYGTPGAGLYHNDELKNDILYAIEWLYRNRYGEAEMNGTGWHSTSGYNWWDWKIGSPINLVKSLLIMEDDLTAAEIKNYLALFDKLVPVPYGTGSNALNTAQLAIGSALLQNDGAKVIKMQTAVEDVYLYVDNGRNRGEGFYTDGSYVFHGSHPMNGTYGLEQFQLTGPFVAMFAGTPFEITTPQVDNVTQWVFDAFNPLVYRGAMFRMVKGRYPRGMHTTGKNYLSAVLDAMDVFSADDQKTLKSLIKAQVLEDTGVNFYTALTLPQVLKLVKIMNDESIAADAGKYMNHVYNNEDKVVHQRGNFALGLSMSSERIFGWESINMCNMNGWYLGDGMTEYYTADNPEQSSDAYWDYVNPYRLPGTTVDTRERKTASIAGGNEYLSSKDFVGAVSLDETYGAAAMDLESYHFDADYGTDKGEYGGPAPARDCNLEAKKAWFMFDDEVVCLGSDITASNDAEVITVVDNKLAKNIKKLSDAEETAAYEIVGAQASDTPEEENIAANTIDGDYTTKWAAEKGATITWDLGAEKELGFIALSFLNGTKRVQYFDLEVSSDNRSWTKVFSGGSSGNRDMNETFSLDNSVARYVRLTNNGNSSNKWVSLTEAEIYAPNTDGSIAVNAAEVIGSDKFIADGGEISLTDADTDLTGKTWAHFENSGGYYFPGGGNLFARYTKQTNSFMELWLSHGVNPTGGAYSYVLLPSKTAEETSRYAENPDIEILSNTAEIQAVREKTLGITGIVFRKAGTFRNITADKPMIVMVREKDGQTAISASDPTHKLDSAKITVNKALTPTEYDPLMDIDAQDSTVISLNLENSDGRTLQAVFDDRQLLERTPTVVTDSDDREISELVSDTAVNISSDVKNSGSTAARVHMIAAQYNAGGTLLACKCRSEIIPAGDVKKWRLEGIVTESGAARLKTFVLNENLSPVAVVTRQ